MEDYPVEELRKLEEKSQLGELMERFLNESYDIFNKNILIPMEDGAFEAFKKIKADDTIGIIETQMMSKVITTIRSTIESRIREGQLARETIKSLNALPDEG